MVFALANDITERTREEYEIEEKYKKYKSIATHFKSRIEEKRKYLAIELHEELAQLASIIRTDIDAIDKRELSLSDFSKGRAAHALSVSDQLINSIRRISFSISPTMLPEVGLEETLRWLCQEFAVENGIPYQFESNFNNASLTDVLQLDIFRICQEAFMNIILHAKASQVFVKLEEHTDRICLFVIDDGIGFAINEVKSIPGLTIMRERAASISGRFFIESVIGRGTSISVCVDK